MVIESPKMAPNVPKYGLDIVLLKATLIITNLGFCISRACFKRGFYKTKIYVSKYLHNTM